MSLRDRILAELDRREQMARWITEVRPGPWRAVATHVNGALDAGQRIFAAPVPGPRPGEANKPRGGEL